MKFVCSTANLNEAVMNVSLAVSPKSTMTALEGILVTAQDNHVRLAGYDLSLSITTQIEAKVDHDGEVIIPAKLFADIIRKIDSGTIEISCDSRYLVEIQGGVSQFTILGMSSFEFPELPQVGDGIPAALPQNKLRSMIDQTLFAVAASDIKPAHTGCLFLLEGEDLSVVAVDGFRLALRREKVSPGTDMRFIVPGKSLGELLKLLDDDETPIDLSVSKKHILFVLGRTTVTSRLLEGDFLDYHAAIPQDSSTQVTVSVRGLISSIERTALLISDRLKSPLRVLFDQGMIKMSCSTTMGKAYDECASATTGKTVEMGFNNRYLMDALKHADCDMVRLQINGPLSPMKVVPLEGDHFLFLVLPMKLKSE